MSSENFNNSSMSGQSFTDDQIKDFFKQKFKDIKTQEPPNVKLVDKDEDGGDLSQSWPLSPSRHLQTY